MTKKELLRRIEDLERRVLSLEARQPFIIASPPLEMPKPWEGPWGRASKTVETYPLWPSICKTTETISSQ